MNLIEHTRTSFTSVVSPKRIQFSESSAVGFNIKTDFEYPDEDAEVFSDHFQYGALNPAELLYAAYCATRYTLATAVLKALHKEGHTDVTLAYENIVVSADAWEYVWKGYKDMDAFLRIRKNADSFTVSIKTLELDLDLNALLHMTTYYDTQRDVKVNDTALHLGVVGLLGSDMLNMMATVDLKINRPNLPAPLLKEMEDTAIITEEGFVAFSTLVTGLRVISPPVTKTWRAQFHADEPREETEQPRQVTDLADCPKQQQEDYVAHALTNRVSYAFMEMTFPAPYIEWMVQRSHKKALASDVGSWFKQWADDMFAGTLDAFEWKNSSIADIARSNKGAEKEYRVNKESLALDRDGVAYFIPEVDHTKAHEKLTEDAGTSASGDWLLVSHDAVREGAKGSRKIDDTTVKQDRERPNFPANRLVYVDWVNLKLSYTDTKANLEILDVETFMPATTNSMVKMLELPLTTMDGEGRDASTIASFYRAMQVVTRNLTSEVDTEAVRQFFGIARNEDGDRMLLRLIDPLRYGSIKEYLSGLTRLTMTVSSWYDGGLEAAANAVYTGFTTLSEDGMYRLQEFSTPKAWKLSEITGTTEILPLRYIRTLVEEVHGLLFADVTESLARHSVINGMKELAVLHVVASHAPGFAELKALDAKQREPYTKNIDILKYDVTPAAGFTEGRSFLPHQAKLDAYLNEEPDNAILAVSAGGGKTMQMLKDMASNMDKGLVKRPLILCPTGLTRQYVEESAYFLGGRYNVLVLTTDNVNKINKERGEDWLNNFLTNPPPNTIVVASYDYIKQGRTKVPYGRVSMDISANTELVKQYRADIVYADESHRMRNPDSIQSRAVQRLVTSIPKRRLATGTFLTNRLSDVVGQFRLIDPSVFGDLDDFTDRYAEEVRGKKVLKWKAGAEAEVHSLLSAHSRLLIAKRKEWQFLLPEKEERFISQEPDENDEFTTGQPLVLSASQRSVYESILADALEEIKNDAKIQEKLKEIQESVDEDGVEDEEVALSLEAALKRHIARLEEFLTDPGGDELGDQLLEGADRIGPKVRAVHSIIRKHLKDRIPGKIMVFTQYHRTADAIFDTMDPELQKMCIRYRTGSRDQDLAVFNRDPSVQVLIGVETSLAEGFNLQVASRMIRTEAVWNPGTLEQAESRINRPNPKNKETRTKIYMDWVLVDKTIDITKTARLMSKVLETIRFEEHSNPLYANVPDVPIVSMSFDTIQGVNSFDSHLMDYMQAYKEFKVAEKLDYKQTRESSEFRTEYVPIPVGPSVEGSVLVPMPYVPDHVLPNMEVLGIQRYSDYVVEQTELELATALATYDPADHRAHTEWGDGTILKTQFKNFLKIQIDGEDKPRNVPKLETFIILDPNESSTVTDRLVDLTGIPVVGKVKIKKLKVKKAPPVVEAPTEDIDDGEISDGALELPTEAIKKVRKKREAPVVPEIVLPPVEKKVKSDRPVPNSDFKAQGSFEVYLSVINNQVAVTVDEDDPDVPVGVLKKMGFKFSGPYLYAKVRNALAMRRVLAALEENYTVPPTLLGTLYEMNDAFNEGKARLFNVTQTAAVEMKNFFRLRKVATPKGVLKPYPVVQDGELYLCIDLTSQPEARKVSTKIRIPGLTWETSNGEYWKFSAAGNKKEALDTIKEIIDLGYVISNKKTLKEEYKEIRLVKGGRK